MSINPLYNDPNEHLDGLAAVVVSEAGDAGIFPERHNFKLKRDEEKGWRSEEDALTTPTNGKKQKSGVFPSNTWHNTSFPKRL